MQSQVAEYEFQQDKQSSNYKKNKVRKAELAASAALPHTYYFNSNNNSLENTKEEVTEESNDIDSLFRFFVLGCQGNGKEAQKKVAELLKKIAEDPAHKPEFIILLGDNFYDWGIGSPDDPAVNNCFYNIYNELKKLNIPIFVISGNHDANYHAGSFLKKENGKARLHHEVAISYLPDEKHPTVEEKVDLYRQDHLVKDELPFWNMPHRFYSIVKNDTQILFLDSSTYVADFLEYIKDPANTPITNQAKWLAEQNKDAALNNRTTIVAMHHPLYTLGKRAYESDIQHYFKNKVLLNEVRNFFEIPIVDGKYKDCSYNDLLRECFRQQEFDFDLLLNAHDHCNYFYSNKNNSEKNPNYYPTCELVAGGGGGGLQDRLNFHDQEHVGFFLKEFGFSEIICDHNETYFITRTDKHEFHFNIHDLKPDHKYVAGITEEEKSAIIRFKDTIKKGIDDYFKFLNAKQKEHHGEFFSFKPGAGNISHGAKGRKDAHELWAVINEYNVDNYETIVDKIHSIARWEKTITHRFFTSPTENSLITKINNAIKNEYGNKYDLNRLFQERHPYQNMNQVAIA